MNILKAYLKLLLGKGIFKSFSQNGEDALINSFTRGIKKGTYIDVGGFHPTLYSNTYSLYRRGWKGVVVEPNPEVKWLFKVVRPRDTLVQCGVSAQNAELEYSYFDDAAYNTFDAAQAREWEAQGVRKIKTESISTKSLATIIREADIRTIDVMSVDVEGMDLEALQSHDWNMAPKIVVAECHGFDVEKPHATPLYEFLTSKGYTLAGIAGFSLVFKLK